MAIVSDFRRLKGFRFPREVIAYAVWVYHRFAMSAADVEDLLAERGVIASPKPSAFGSTGLEALSDAASVEIDQSPETSGTWMKWLSQSVERSIGCGAQLMPIVMFWIFSCRPGATTRRHVGFSANSPINMVSRAWW
jgi:putative transposase